MNKMAHAPEEDLKIGMHASSPYLLNMLRDITPAIIRKKDTASAFPISLNIIWISSMKFSVPAAVVVQEDASFLSISFKSSRK
jgi:hypothetical protein